MEPETRRRLGAGGRVWIGTVASVVVVGSVLALVGVGAVRVVSENRSSRDLPKPAGASPAATDRDLAEPWARPAPADVLVDLRTGTATPLPDRIATIERLAGYQASPDGRLVAFMGPGIEGNPPQIYVAERDGSRARSVTDGPIITSAPRWSPDGTRIVYEIAGASDQHTDIFVVGVTDPRPWRTTVRMRGSDARFRQVGAAPSFSADGRTILFTRATGDGRFDVRTVPATGGLSRLLIRDAAYASASPDGRTIAYHRMVPGNEHGEIWPHDVGIWLADADGTNRRPLPNADGFERAPLSWKRLGPVWSPDGTRIAFVRPTDTTVYVADADTGELTPVGRGGGATWVDEHTLAVDGFGAEVPAFSLTDLAGRWFLIDRGEPTFLFVGANGGYFIENDGGVHSGLDESGTVEIRGDDVWFSNSGEPSGWVSHEGATRACPAHAWALLDVRLTTPGRMTADGGIPRCGESPPWPSTTFRSLDDPLRVASVDPGEVERIPAAELVGVWWDGDAFYRYAADGTFAYYWADADYSGSFELGEAGTWELLRDGRLRILYEGGRACIGPDGSMSSFNLYSKRPHLIELQDVDWTPRGVMSLSTVRDDCHETVGDRSLQHRLYPRPTRFTNVDTIASGMAPGLDGREPWRLAVFRDNFEDRLCIGFESDRGFRDRCGPASDPIPGWTADVSSPIGIADWGGSGGFGRNFLFGWGVFGSPVTSIRAEEREIGSQRWHETPSLLSTLAPRYRAELSIFVVHCECKRVRIVGLDAAGRRVGHVRLS